MNADKIELRPALENALRRHDPNLGRIVRLSSDRCADQTSFKLVDIEVELENGTVLRILLKDLGMDNLHETARRVKPAFLYNPWREIETYRDILAPKRLGTAHFYGAVVSPNENRYWLLLEKVAGLRLCQVSDYSDWQRLPAGWHTCIPALGENVIRSIDPLPFCVTMRRSTVCGFSASRSFNPFHSVSPSGTRLSTTTNEPSND